MFYRCSPSQGPDSLEVHGFYHSETGSTQYLVHDTQSHQAALIDAVLDFDPAKARSLH